MSFFFVCVSGFLFVLFLFSEKETGFLGVALELTLCRPGCAQTQSYVCLCFPNAKACTTPPGPFTLRQTVFVYDSKIYSL